MSFDTVRFSRADINNINLGKRRPLNPLNWADRKNKNNKDKGLAYKVLKGRRAGLTIPAIIQPTGEKFCPCKKAGCCQDPKFYTDLYKSFREINADQQNQLLAECLEIQEPKSRRIDPKNAIKIKKHSYSYSVKVRGRRIPVCRMRLLDTFKVTNNRIRTIISKLESGKVTFEDGRGKTTGWKNTICIP
ncbi:unnamed protein product [Allacma fusca]|uniref:Uncharacterized protein n=1 Tax=Allacma fusca TaxID=39272 RepID=A0A8J2J468_9HEXA|nr:unnamed protein product [Allacma fusca]